MSWYMIWRGVVSSFDWCTVKDKNGNHKNKGSKPTHKFCQQECFCICFMQSVNRKCVELKKCS